MPLRQSSNVTVWVTCSIGFVTPPLPIVKILRVLLVLEEPGVPVFVNDLVAAAVRKRLGFPSDTHRTCHIFVHHDRGIPYEIPLDAAASENAPLGHLDRHRVALGGVRDLPALAARSPCRLYRFHLGSQR